MNKTDKVRNLEAARVLLIQADSMLRLAKEKLLEIYPANGRVQVDYHDAAKSMASLIEIAVEKQ